MPSRCFLRDVVFECALCYNKTKEQRKGERAMSDVVFITPNYRGRVVEESLGTLQLATVLKEDGIVSRVVPFSAFGDLSDFSAFLENAVQTVAQISPKIISFYTRCDVYHIDVKLAEVFKAHFPETYIVFGGPQSDLVARETLESLPGVDFVCCGEGEETVVPFFRSLLKNEPDCSVAGLGFRKGGAVFVNARPEAIADLDLLPLIDYSFAKGLDLGEDEFFPVDVGRGCPFSCTYCSTKTFWGRNYRLKSPERIRDEIADLHRRYGRTRFAFTHDMFTLNRERVLETCAVLESFDFPIEWKCSARLDCLDRELIDRMAEAGLKQIFIGIETGSERMQKIIQKNLKLDRAEETVAYLCEKGIRVTASLMYGFPEETAEDVSDTMNLVMRLMNFSNVDIQLHLCAFLPGTELTARYAEQLTATSVYSDITGQHAVEECSELFEKYPNLFLQMYEYKTELRWKLRHFRTFFDLFRAVPTVYEYLSRQYAAQRFRLYEEFLAANEQLLDQTATLPYQERNAAVLLGDRFLENFAEDENFDLLNEIYRFERMGQTARETKEVQTDLFTFSPTQLKNGVRLENLVRQKTLVSCFVGEDGQLRYKVQTVRR